jgi:hypothetical protein
MPQKYGPVPEAGIRNLKVKALETELQYEVILKITGYHILWTKLAETKIKDE